MNPLFPSWATSLSRPRSVVDLECDVKLVAKRVGWKTAVDSYEDRKVNRSFLWGGNISTRGK
jgi:hypothetical protein